MKHMFLHAKLLCFVCCIFLTYGLAAAPTTVSGTVNSVHKTGLIAVSVYIKGTTMGTQTNSDGTYSLTIPATVNNPVLIFSSIGFVQQEQVIGTRSVVDIILEENTSELDEVVVVGYGTVKKANLTGSVSVIKYDKAMESRPITDASQALSGTASGVWVSQNSGSPGGDGATIRVRGYGTLNNTDPLILIDGVEGKLGELNPNDIESLTVLKDAASAAIYGSRAANGVVLVETKKGKGEEKVTLNYNSYIGIQQLGRRYNLISNSAEYMDIWNAALRNNGASELFPADVVDAFRKGGDPYKYPNTNYFDEVFRSAFTTQQNLSITMNSKKSSTYISLSYLDQDGIIKNTSSNRAGITLNNTSTISKWLKMGIRSRIMRKNSVQPYDSIYRVMYMMANGHPFSTPYLQDGTTLGGTQAVYLSGPRAGEPIVDTRNPFPDLLNGEDRRTNNFYKVNVFATVQLLPELSITGQYTAQNSNNIRDRHNQDNFTYREIGNEATKGKSLDYPSTLNIQRAGKDDFYTTSFANINYNKLFNEAHDLSIMLGSQIEDFTTKTFSAQKSDPPKEGLTEVNSGTSSPIALGSGTRWRMLSYFGRINYVYKGKYLLETNFRADASSRFKKGNRWGYFPSVSAAWRLSEESFVKNTNWFDNLKLRLSWGRLGNQAIDNDWPYLMTIDQVYGTSYNFAGQLAPGAAIRALKDANLTWETTTTSDLGLDMRFLKNKLNIEIDYFNRVTTDIIVQLPLMLMMGGVTPPFENVGEMKNTGLEISANWSDKIKSSDFSYGIGANITFLENKVTKFQGGKSPDQLFLIREGYSYKTLYGFKAEGIYQSDAEALAHMYVSKEPKAGSIKYKDKNGDGKLDYLDKEELGNTIPKISYGITANLGWKGFDLSMLFQGVAKVYGYSQNAWTQPLAVSGGTITERWRDAWTPERHSTTLPKIKVNDNWSRQESSFWVTELSWFKLKNIQLGYTVPEVLSKKISLTRAYLYVNATNVFTLVSKDYEGFDPERDTFTSGYNQYPTPKVWSFGINLTF